MQRNTRVEHTVRRRAHAQAPRSVGGPPATRRDTAQVKGTARPTAVLLCWRRYPLDSRALGRVLGPRCSNNQSTRTLTSDLTATNRCAGPVRGSTRDESCPIAAPALGAGPSAPSGPPQAAGGGCDPGASLRDLQGAGLKAGRSQPWPRSALSLCLGFSITGGQGAHPSSSLPAPYSPLAGCAREAWPAPRGGWTTVRSPPRMPQTVPHHPSRPQVAPSGRRGCLPSG